jgi:hypothetical protein
MRNRKGLHVKDFHNFLPDITEITKSWRMRLASHEEGMGDNKNPYKILIGIPETNRSFCRLE